MVGVSPGRYEYLINYLISNSELNENISRVTKTAAAATLAILTIDKESPLRIGIHNEGLLPIHVHPGSIVQMEEQPFPAEAPSSHSSNYCLFSSLQILIGWKQIWELPNKQMRDQLSNLNYIHLH